ncbi:hypothetical protein Slin14017_G098530 [Septoria linicola]|nr:hypothetical protein Slin14017_G098530 [Septoria linicola]
MSDRLSSLPAEMVARIFGCIQRRADQASFRCINKATERKSFPAFTKAITCVKLSNMIELAAPIGEQRQVPTRTPHQALTAVEDTPGIFTSIQVLLVETRIFTPDPTALRQVLSHRPRLKNITVMHTDARDGRDDLVDLSILTNNPRQSITIDELAIERTTIEIETLKIALRSLHVKKLPLLSSTLRASGADGRRKEIQLFQTLLGADLQALNIGLSIHEVCDFPKVCKWIATATGRQVYRTTRSQLWANGKIAVRECLEVLLEKCIG